MLIDPYAAKIPFPASGMEPWDRFAICEAWSCLAHDWGMYGIAERLERMRFRPSPILRTENLDFPASEIYAEADRKLREMETPR